MCAAVIKENQQVVVPGTDVSVSLPTPGEGVVYSMPADMVNATVV